MVESVKGDEVKDPVSVSHMNRIATAQPGEVYYRDPRVDPPPLGVMLNIYTTGGIQIKGLWRDDLGYLAWAPLLKVPDWLRERAHIAYTARK